MKNFSNRALVAKKTIIVLAAIFSAIFANAQITLEHTAWICHPASDWNRVLTSNGHNNVSGASELPCPFYVEYTKNNEADESDNPEYSTAFIYSYDYSLYKSIDIEKLMRGGYIWAIAY